VLILLIVDHITNDTMCYSKINKADVKQWCLCRCIYTGTLYVLLLTFMKHLS